MSDIFSCCNSPPYFLIKYNVADSIKSYFVCESCVQLDCFTNHVLKKTTLTKNQKERQKKKNKTIVIKEKSTVVLSVQSTADKTRRNKRCLS